MRKATILRNALVMKMISSPLRAYGQMEDTRVQSNALKIACVLGSHMN